MFKPGIIGYNAVAPITYATWNPSDKNANITLSNGNLTITSSPTNWFAIRSTISKTSGKWYWEMKIDDQGPQKPFVGIAKSTASLADGAYLGSDANGWGYHANSGMKFNNGNSLTYGNTYGSGDVIGIALDLDGGTVTFYKNNTSQGVAYTSLSGEFFAGVSIVSSTIITANFGATAMAYTAPSGYNQGLYE